MDLALVKRDWASWEPPELLSLLEEELGGFPVDPKPGLERKEKKV